MGVEGLVEIKDVPEIFQAVALGLLHHIVVNQSVNNTAKIQGGPDVPTSQNSFGKESPTANGHLAQALTELLAAHVTLTNKSGIGHLGLRSVGVYGSGTQTLADEHKSLRRIRSLGGYLDNGFDRCVLHTLYKLKNSKSYSRSVRGNNGGPWRTGVPAGKTLHWPD